MIWANVAIRSLSSDYVDKHLLKSSIEEISLLQQAFKWSGWIIMGTKLPGGEQSDLQY